MPQSFFIILVLFIASPLLAIEKMQIAVLDLQPKGSSTIIAGAVTDMIRSDMVDAGVFSVVERNQMDQILREQGFQASGCNDQACAVQMGKLLSAKKILVGEVTQVGKNILITVRIVDVENGVAEFSAKETAQREEDLEQASRKISNKLVDSITGHISIWERIIGHGEEDISEPVPFSDTGYYLRGIVPGWGQIYSGDTIKGYGFMSAFVISAGISAWAIMDYEKKKNAYGDLRSTDSPATFESKWDAYKKASTISLISVGIVGAIYIAHWVDMLLFPGPRYSITANEQRSEKGVFFRVAPIYDPDCYSKPRLTISAGTRF